MIRTEQKSIRLGRYYSRIVEKLQEEKGLTFTDAIKEIIMAYNRTRQDISLIERLEKVLSNKEVSEENETVETSYAILDSLHSIEKALLLVQKGILVLGKADVRTTGPIEDLFEDETP